MKLIAYIPNNPGCLADFLRCLPIDDCHYLQVTSFPAEAKLSGIYLEIDQDIDPSAPVFEGVKIEVVEDFPKKFEAKSIQPKFNSIEEGFEFYKRSFFNNEKDLAIAKEQLRQATELYDSLHRICEEHKSTAAQIDPMCPICLLKELNQTKAKLSEQAGIAHANVEALRYAESVVQGLRAKLDNEIARAAAQEFAEGRA